MTIAQFAGASVTWSGAGRWNGQRGYRYVATAIDLTRSSFERARRRRAGARDQLAISIVDPDGRVVYATASQIEAGEITVRPNADEHDEEGDWHVRE